MAALKICGGLPVASLLVLVEESAKRKLQRVQVQCRCRVDVEVESAKDARRPVSSQAHLPWFGTVSASLLF